MKKKELKELHTRPILAIRELVKKEKQAVHRLRMDLSAGKLKNVHLVSQKRRDLARLKTILREKELNQ